jgi:cell division protein FtsQ
VSQKISPDRSASGLPPQLDPDDFPSMPDHVAFRRDGAAPARKRLRRRRAHAVHGTPLWSWPLTVFGVLVVLAGAWWVTNSPVFDLRELRLQGAERLSLDEVKAIAGLDDRTNVLWLSLAEVESRLEGNPWILEASVERSLPSTMSLSILERIPVAAVRGDGLPMLVAADGTVLGHSGEPPGLPLLEGAVSELRPGQRLGAAPELRVAAALPRPLRGRVEGIEVDDDGVLALSLEGGVQSLYGDATQAAEKGQALLAVLRWAEAAGVPVGSVDVRVPAAPALLPGKPSSVDDSRDH